MAASICVQQHTAPMLLMRMQRRLDCDENARGQQRCCKNRVCCCDDPSNRRVAWGQAAKLQVLDSYCHMHTIAVKSDTLSASRSCIQQRLEWYAGRLFGRQLATAACPRLRACCTTSTLCILVRTFTQQPFRHRLT